MGILDLLRGPPQRPLAQGTRRTDSTGGRWVNGSGLGGPTDTAQATEWIPGEPVGQWGADNLLQFNGVARRVAGAEAQDCTRAGYDITEMDAGLADEIEQVVEGGKKGPGLEASSKVAEGRTWARAYGGGGVVMLVDDGRQPSEPIDLANIRRVRGLLSFTRYEMPVVQWGGVDSAHFGLPEIYQLNLNRGGGGGQQVRVHADRVIRIRGVPIPRPLQLRQQGWDGSVFDLIWPSLRDYQASLALLPAALRMLSQGVLTSPALANALETDEGAAAYWGRLQAFAATRGQHNVVGLGGEETYAEHSRTMAGAKDAIDALMAGLVANSDGMPRLVLLGEPTAGLSSTEKGELEVWYGSCEAKHPLIYTPAIRRVIDMVQLSHEGPTGGRLHDYTIKWRSLWQASESTRAATDLSRAQRRATDIASTVITPEQARMGDPSVRELYDLPDGAIGPVGGVVDPTVEPEQESLEAVVASVAETALNGAQQAQLREHVISFNEGGITHEQAIGLIGTSLPSLKGNEERVLGSDPGPRPPAAGPIEGMPDQQVTPDDAAVLVEAAPSAEPIPDDLMSVKEIKELFRMPANTINKLMASGKLPYWGLGTHKRVSRAAVQEASTAHLRPPDEPE